MRLSEDVRSELAAIEPRKAHCRLAELSALVRSAGSVHLRGGGRIGVHLEVGNGAVARRAVGLLRGYGVACEIRTYRRRAFDRPTRFQIHLEDDARSVQALNEAGILGPRLEPLERPPRRVVAHSCCRAAYLRGALLAAGSVSGPRDAHLELRTEEPEGAAFLAELAAADGFTLGVATRRGHAFAYAKGGEAIADLLAYPRRERSGAQAGRGGGRRGHARAREPPGERGPREPRPRQPRRGSAAPCDRAPRVERPPRRARAGAPRDRAPPAPPSDGLAAGARGPLPPAGHEDGRPPPPREDPEAGRRLTRPGCSQFAAEAS